MPWSRAKGAAGRWALSTLQPSIFSQRTTGVSSELPTALQAFVGRSDASSAWSPQGRGHTEEEADRGGAPAGGDQPGVGAREVDPSRASLHPAPVVGATPAGRLPGGALRVTGRRPVRPPRPLPHRGGPARGAGAAL